MSLPCPVNSTDAPCLSLTFIYLEKLSLNLFLIQDLRTPSPCHSVTNSLRLYNYYLSLLQLDYCCGNKILSWLELPLLRWNTIAKATWGEKGLFSFHFHIWKNVHRWKKLEQELKQSRSREAGADDAEATEGAACWLAPQGLFSLLVCLVQLWCYGFYLVYFILLFCCYLLEVCSFPMRDRKEVDLDGRERGEELGEV